MAHCVMHIVLYLQSRSVSWCLAEDYEPRDSTVN